MYSFTISPGTSWYTDPKTNNRKRGIFLHQEIDAFYHEEYQPGDANRRETSGTVENIITILKNRYENRSQTLLTNTQNNLIQILSNDLPQILRRINKNQLTVCVIPRSKVESNYSTDQLLFKTSVINAVYQLPGFSDGTSFLIRHTNTRTTHLDRAGMGGDGDLPYPGITKATCNISPNVSGKNILLIDDLYTETINIDEDAIQALLDSGANSVVFYSLGKTAPRQQPTIII